MQTYEEFPLQNRFFLSRLSRQVAAAQNKPLEFPLTLTNRFASVHVYQSQSRGYTTHRICWREGRHRRREAVADPLKAHRRAEEILEDLTERAGTRNTGTAETWAYYKKCEEMLGDIPLIKAVQFYLDHHKTLPKVPDASLLDVVELFIEAKDKAGCSVRYMRALKSTLKNLTSKIKKPIRLVRVQDLDAYLSQFTQKRTRYNHRLTLITLWRWAQSKEYLPQNEKTAAEKTEIPRVDTKEPGILTPEDLGKFLRLLETKCPGLIPFVTIGAWAGVRTAEICRLDWKDIDLKGGYIHLSSSITKTRRRRVVHMHPTLKRWLNAFENETGLVCKENYPHKVMLKLWRQISTKPWPHNALRHSAVTYSMALRQNAAYVAEQSGHSMSELQSSYKAMSTPETAKKWFQIKPSPNQAKTIK